MNGIEKIVHYIREITNKKLFTSVIWLGGGGGAEFGLRFIRNIILVRILAPEAFGLMAIVLAANKLFETFTQIGLKEAVVQDKRGNEREYLNTVWWVGTIRGIIIYCVAYAIAPIAAKVFNSVELTALLRVSFLSCIFFGAMSPRAFAALKNMNYKVWVTVWHGGSIIGIVTTIVSANIYPTIWALVLGFLTEHVARLILSFIFCSFLPRFNLQKMDLIRVMKFAKGMVGIALFYFIYIQSDVFIIGKIYSKELLGLYSMTSNLAQMPSLLITMLVQPIMLPIYSRLQDDKNELNNVTENITKNIIILGLPILLACILYSKEIIHLIYGENYAKMAIPFSVVLTRAFITTIGAPIAALYLGIGKPELERKYSFVRAMLVLILIYPLVLVWGITGAAFASLFSVIVALYLQIGNLNKTTKLDKYIYVKYALNSIGPCIPVVFGWFLYYKNGFNQNTFYIYAIVSLIIANLVILKDEKIKKTKRKEF